MIPDTWMKGPLMWAVLGFVLVAILLTAVWDLATDQAEQRVRAEQSAQYHIEYAEDRIDQECLSLESDALRDCIHKEIESARDHGRANQDLKAQQQMALFTKIMAWTTAGGLVLGIVSIAVIYATLTEMGRTNQIMREEQRPWLVIDAKSVPRETLSKMYRSRRKERMSIQAINKGRLPAKDAICTFAIFSRDTISSEEVGEIIEQTFASDFDGFFHEKSTIFQDNMSHVVIEPMPRDKRVFGNGHDWMLMVAVLYFWDDKIKIGWNFMDTEAPPENVLKHQKT